ncbi:MAG: transglycosylase SLT domain-containing protein [Actinomycetota bacterium]
MDTAARWRASQAARQTVPAGNAGRQALHAARRTGGDALTAVTRAARTAIDGAGRAIAIFRPGGGPPSKATANAPHASTKAPATPAPARSTTTAYQPARRAAVALPLRRARRTTATPIYSYVPPTVVSDAIFVEALPRRWPSRVAPIGLALVVGMGLTGMIAASPKGPQLAVSEDALSMRLPYEPSKLLLMDPASWAPALPMEAQPWIPPIQAIAAEEGLDPRLLASLVWVESRFDPAAISPKGAVGLAQVMPDTARELGIRIKDPLENLAGGAHYLSVNLKRFGRLDLALSAYNGGPNRVTNPRTLSTAPEVKDYVRRVLAHYRGLGGEPGI